MNKPMYQNPAYSIAQRVRDLMARMSLDEKVRQLGCAMNVGTETPPEAMDLAPGIGQVAMMGGGATPQQTATNIRQLQQHIVQNSPHGIPAIFHCEALSGPVLSMASLFPASISLGATFNPDIVLDMCERTRRQMLALGVRQALSPVLDISRDLRWGRIGETYGGDPTLVASMSCAFVEGLQGKDMRQGVAATAKHFLGYSETEGGLNMAKTKLDKRDLREVYAKPFEAAIRQSGLRSVMNSYSEIDGQPVCASSEILTDMLRGELGFDGIVVSDYMSIPRLVKVFHTAENLTDAAIQCLTAGLDVECPNREGYSDEFTAAAAAGQIDIGIIDRSVERVLRLKFELGLFENPYADADELAPAFDNTENEEKSLEAALESMTLTKNDGILPLQDKTTKIAVIGPSAKSLRLMYSCYTYPAMAEMLLGTPQDMAGLVDANDTGKKASGAGSFGMASKRSDMEPANELIRVQHPAAKTLLEALEDRFENLTYAEGCSYNNVQDAHIAQAVAAAQKADVVVLALCGKNGWGLHCTTGEGVDSSSLDLPGAQELLMRSVIEANPRTVIVHTDARPLVSEWAYEHAAAIIEGWLPCTFGGTAIAQTLTGENNPAGRLPLDVPRSAGHTPHYHYQQNGSGWHTFASGAINNEGYMDALNTPLRPFGYGLSYTSFVYSGFALQVSETGQAIASVRVRNSGELAGNEVVQLYGRDLIASIIRPEQELIGFKRLSLQAGEERLVEFHFNLSQLAFLDVNGQWVVEKGEFAFWASPHSAERTAEAMYTQPVTRIIESARRGYFAEAEVRE